MEINPQREDYLTTIFKLNIRKGKANNKEISQWLNVAPSSVTEMIKKLKKEGLVADNPENIELTEKGQNLAKSISSKHRLWEYFMTEILKYDWKDVHDQAKLLQSVTSEHLFESLNNFLGRPEYCPHGGIIFANADKIEYKERPVKLSDAEAGFYYQIKKVADDPALLDYTKKLDLKLNQLIYLDSFESFDNSIIIKSKDKSLVLSPKAGQQILVIKEI